MSFISEVKVQDLKELQELSIEDCEELEQIIVEDNEEDHPQSLFCSSLRKINVKNCGKLKYLFPVTLAQGLQQLESIWVWRCARLEKVFGHKDGAVVTNDVKEIILPQLKWLSLDELPSLTNFGHAGYHFILKLNSLSMECCYNMGQCYLGCNEGHGIVSVFGLQREMRSLEDVERLCKGPTNVLSPKNLLKLCIIKPCCRLKHVFPSNVARDLLQLRELYIFNCEELEQIIMIEDEEEDHIKIPFFPNLTKIDVGRCNKLKHLFPITIAAGHEQLQSIHEEGNVGPVSYHFPKLQELYIKDCEELEQIIVEDHPHSLVFRSLRKIDVDSCGKLKHLFPITLAQGLQQLESIMVRRCPQLEKLFGHKDGVGVMNDVKEIILPQLKILSLIELPSLTKFGPMDYHFILKLNSLRIRDCHKYQMSGEYRRGLVIVIHGLECELRSPEGAEGFFKGFTNSLSPNDTFAVFISKCDGLQHIFSSNLARGLSQLKELYIRDCKELEQIIDEEDHIQTPFFPNLSEIGVSGCNKLKHLFPITIAAGLQQLQSMHVEGCHQLQRVFEHKNGADDMNDKEIVLPQLKSLSFIELPNLTSFGPVGYHFPKQYLWCLYMEGCNEQMWKICLGDDVEDFFVDSFKVDAALYEGDHVSVAFRLGNGGCEYRIKSGVKESDLRCVGDRIRLSSVCRGLTLTFTLINLSRLMIEECHKMRHIFSSNLARNLLQLEDLDISNCEELEQVIVEDDEDDHIQIPFFPNLRRIEISGCNKLKYVFPIAMVRVSLQKLGRIVVEECDELEEVLVDGDRDVDDEQVLLSQLSRLKLEKLRKLANFCSTGYHCMFPSLEKLKVNECPKMATRFSYESENGSVHAEAKAPNEGGNNGDEPTMDIYCFRPFEHHLPPFMAEMTSKGLPGKET